jgi:two-component system chemotaxis sensor kinase CheA
MVIHRSRLEERLRQDGALEGARETLLGLGRSLREMREAISSARMVPVGEIFDRIPYLVRDMARATDKKARVALEGNQTEIDKFLVERLREPVLHLVRNCFAHGVEPAAERTAAGKPAEALILLRASSAADSVFIQVSDDGRGVEADTVFTRAAALGLPVPEDSDPKSLLDVLCTPGFSSRDTADMSAGRGIGMTVVAAAARELGGSLSMRTSRGKGTEFTLRLPLSISICDAVVLGVGGAKFTMNKGAIHEIVQAEPSAVRSVRSTELVPYREGMLPLVRLRAALAMAPSSAPKLVVVVAGTSRGPVGFVADSVVAQREIVVRPLSDPFLRVPGIAGVTELGDGRPVLVLDPETLNAAQAARPALAT